MAGPRRLHGRRQIRHGWLTEGKSGSRRRHVGGIPSAKFRQRGMGERAAQIGPDPRLVAEILRLAIAAVEPGEGAEQAGVTLRRHDGVEFGKPGGIEIAVCRASRLD
ncbi:conserved hypothetical protein, partial [Ricinus communis]